VVRERKRTVTQLQTSPAFQVTTAKTWATIFAGGPPVSQPVATIPVLRRWLGDEAIQEIGYYPSMRRPQDPSVDRLAQMFPEAKVHEVMILYEPCHPGCFPHGTLVETPRGPRAIGTISVASQVIAYRKTGEQFTARVQSVFNTENRLWRVTTEAGELLTTETQPLCLSMDDSLTNYQVRRAG